MYVNENLTQRVLIRLLQLLNKVSPKNHVMPSTLHTLFQEGEDHALDFEITEDYYCKDSGNQSEHIKKGKAECRSCVVPQRL